MVNTLVLGSVAQGNAPKGVVLGSVAQGNPPKMVVLGQVAQERAQAATYAQSLASGVVPGTVAPSGSSLLSARNLLIGLIVIIIIYYAYKHYGRGI
jgi:hypothetical protein